MIVELETLIILLSVPLFKNKLLTKNKMSKRKKGKKEKKSIWLFRITLPY
jgi:hypothetical protein